jgi:hypothetical protein
MQKYIERMVQEKTDLEGKIKRAKNAVLNPPYGIDKKGLCLLAEQIKYMEQYLSILSERIEYEGVKNGR